MRGLRPRPDAAHRASSNRWRSVAGRPRCRPRRAGPGDDACRCRSTPRPPPRCRCRTGGPSFNGGRVTERDATDQARERESIPGPVRGGWSSRRDARGPRAGSPSVAPTTSSQMTAEPDGASRRRAVRAATPPARRRPDSSCEDSASPASESSTRWVLASRTSTCSTSTANGRVRQHELIRDVEAPVGAPHGARAREHRRREPGELGPGSVSATPALGIDIPAATISAETRTASRTLRCRDVRATGSLVVWPPWRWMLKHYRPLTTGSDRGPISGTPDRRAADPTGRPCPSAG